MRVRDVHGVPEDMYLNAMIDVCVPEFPEHSG